MRILTIITLCFLSFNIQAQNKYWIFFTDKNGVEFNPYEYFEPQAVERRIKNNYPLTHISDFPVNPHYKNAIEKYADSVSAVLRWLNAMVIYSDEQRVSEIEKFPFVSHIEKQYYNELQICETSSNEKEINIDSITSAQKTLLELQVGRMQGEIFKQNGITGKNIIVAIFDAGFPTVDYHPAFKEIRDENRILRTYDFIKKSENAYVANGHGLATMSCVGGKIDSINIGVATGAKFLLARTERAYREPFSEEEKWMAAAEWADKNGADIISSSLGYTHQRYFYKDMIGESYIAKAAKMAVEKGILVVNSAGNEATDKWKFIITPADVDEVLTVGGTNPSTGYQTSFSSFGPTYDYRLKPNVAALGHVIAASKKGISQTQGTSFSCPLISGFAACVLQMHPDLTVKELMKEIEKSADLYPYFDYSHGYGVPQASYFFYKKRPAKTFEIIDKSGILEINVSDNYIKINSDSTTKKGYQKYLYCHIENKKGYIAEYFVYKLAENENVIYINKQKYPDGKTLRVHYYGYTEEIEF